MFQKMDKVTLVLAAGFLSLVVYMFLQRYESMSATTTAAAAPAAAGAAAQSVSSSPEAVVVDLSGAVINPGVYKLSKNSRVGDLLKEGGGLAKTAQAQWVLKNLNLAQKLYVPFEWDTTQESGGVAALLSSDSKANINTATDAPTTAVSSSTVNVNTATLDQLNELPGIGEVYARKIESGRPFKDLDDFTTRSGIPKSTVEKLQGLISF